MWEVTELLERLDEARDQMHSVLSFCDPTESIYPDWSLKSVLVHIYGWEEVVLRSIEVFITGEETYLLPSQSINAHNAEMVDRASNHDYGQVQKKWEHTRIELKHMLAGLSVDELNARIVFPWGPGGEIGEMVAIIAEHEAEHANDLRTLTEDSREV